MEKEILIENYTIYESVGKGFNTAKHIAIIIPHPKGCGIICGSFPHRKVAGVEDWLLYTKEFDDISSAKKFEKHIKNQKKRDYVERIVRSAPR